MKSRCDRILTARLLVEILHDQLAQVLARPLTLSHLAIADGCRGNQYVGDHRVPDLDGLVDENFIPYSDGGPPSIARRSPAGGNHRPYALIGGRGTFCAP